MREVKIFWMTGEYYRPRGLVTFYRFCYKRGNEFVVKSSRGFYGRNKRRNLERLFRKSEIVSHSIYLPEEFSKDIFFVI